MKLEKLLGKKIREVRSQKNIKLAQLSEHSGVSVAMLSKIENAKVSSPVSVYARIAKALDIPLGKLFSEDGFSAISLVRKNEREKYTRAGYIGESIAYKKSNKKMEPFVHTFFPSSAHAPEYEHDNEELIFVLKGILEFRYGEAIYTLYPGDCVYFDANTKHCSRALGDKVAKAFVVTA